jgi:hypothetical protein
VQTEPLTRDKEAGHDLTAKLAKALVLLDKPVMMERVLLNDGTLPALVLRVDEDVHAVSLITSEAELLELLDDPLSS